MNFWRWSVVEHYTLERWLEFMRVAFPLAKVCKQIKSCQKSHRFFFFFFFFFSVSLSFLSPFSSKNYKKGYAIGSKLFSVPTASELLEWGDRRIGSELDALCDSLARLPGKEVHVFVKDNEDLRREKYAAQQAAKAPKKDETAAVASASASAAAGKGDNNKKGGNNNSGKGGNNNSNKAAAKEEPATIGHLDIRVGVVLSAAPHPDGDTLYVEQIDVGEAKPRTIVSGIKEHIPLDKVQMFKKFCAGFLKFLLFFFIVDSLLDLVCLSCATSRPSPFAVWSPTE